MISTFEQPKQKIDPQMLLGHKSRHLILREIEKRNIDCQVLFHTPRNRREAIYIRLKKDGKYRWISPQRGFFNSKLSCELSLSKFLTNRVLESVGLPVPKSIKIDSRKKIKQISIPPSWVVKPINQTQGKNVVVGLKNIKELQKTISVLSKKYRYLIIEKKVIGSDFRLLVLENKLLGAVKRIPARIKGDGRQTIEQLIEESNKKQRRETVKNFKPFLRKIKIDLEIERSLFKQGLKLKSVPKKDQIIQVRQNANFNTGGEVIDITDKVHPENIKIARRAVKALGLKLGGVDIIAKKISQPITENQGKIIEVNGISSLWIHQYPNHGPGRNVTKQIIDYLFRK